MKTNNNTNELAASTVRSYDRRVRQLMARFQSERSLSSAIETSPLFFVEWLIGRKGNLARNSWRQYKAATLWSLNAANSGFWNACDTVERARAIECLDAESQAGALKKARSTSSRKAKKLSDGDLKALERWFRNSRSRYAAPIMLLLQVGRLTGLRPVEWVGAELQTPEQSYVCKLVVKNAKATRGRAHGAYRTLRWRSLDHSAIKMLLEWFDLVAEITNGPNPRQAFEHYLTGLRGELARVTRMIWPRRKSHITLYSARHEAACRFKMHYPPEIVATLMGHGVDSTAYRHYSRSRIKAGRKPDSAILRNLPLADQTEVSRVRKSGWMQKFLEFQQESPKAQNRVSLTN